MTQIFTRKDSPDETNFTALNERITGDWGLGTGDWGLVFLLSTQHGLNAPLSLTALSTFKLEGSLSLRKEVSITQG
ncbi:MAG: hypothetical protein V7K67_06955 [Nostoc sp.]|uniref:hypothetical protein n=1 Tax=Nostoc sp. TaxID=1180 RepID=UPI002FF7821C